MAKGKVMLQIEVEQTFSTPVTDVPEVWTVVFTSLDGERTVVREIASEKNHAVLLMGTQNNVIVPTIAMTSDVATDVWLAGDFRQAPAILHGPSHVASPPIDGVRLALLRVRDFGLAADPHVAISTVRRIGSHVYLDETAP